MTLEKKKKIRDILRFLGSFICILLYLPAVLAYYMSKENRLMINSDLNRISSHCSLKLSTIVLLLYFLHCDRYFRTLFYYRIDPFWKTLISWIRPGDRYFILSRTMQMGKSCLIAHPYSTILNAERIGDNFSCIHCTTIGDKGGQRPVLGNNVSLGAHVTIIGGVHIGDNVVIGAGSVVVSDVPSNSVVAGNPARVIKKSHETIHYRKC